MRNKIIVVVYVLVSLSIAIGCRKIINNDARLAKKIIGKYHCTTISKESINYDKGVFVSFIYEYNNEFTDSTVIQNIMDKWIVTYHHNNNNLWNKTEETGTFTINYKVTFSDTWSVKYSELCYGGRIKNFSYKYINSSANTDFEKTLLGMIQNRIRDFYENKRKLEFLDRSHEPLKIKEVNDHQLVLIHPSGTKYTEFRIK